MTTATTTSPDESPRELVAVLVDVYRRCLSDTARPKRDAEELARAILDGVRAHRRHGDGAADASCLAVTLVGRTVAAATAGTPRDARFRRDVLEALLRDSDVVSRMVAEFGCQHQVLRHLAAKSASACVLYQLQVSGAVNPAWRGTCERALLSLPAGPELDSCLWSLTSVLRKLLRDHRQELVGTLVTVFDASVGAAARRFLSADRSGQAAGAVADTFCLLLDLLEILAACGPAPSGGARSPHLTHVHAAALLAAVNRAPRYFVSKRLALLLKRAALRKAGEDWLDASAESGADVGVLAAAVSDAVAADWLPSVRVGSPAFFGGAKGGGQDGRCDAVMLRAVGLLVIKSVQRHAAAAPSGARRHLAGLWRFLRDYGVRPTDAAHDCAVLPLLFGEQDDDLMEAAKASLLIFLQLRDDSAPPDDPCAAGCNPHCHFLLLLRAVRWDHRILLDFLMSAETCFLEYLLRYLRYLSSDRRGFAASCRRLDAEAPRRRDGGEGRRTGEDASGRARDCLLRLRLLLARLHGKKLFPYKADALLRLLARAAPPLGPD